MKRLSGKVLLEFFNIMPQRLDEKSTLKNVDLSQKSSAKIQSELKNDKELKNEIIRNFIKDDVSAANKVAAATMYAKGGVSEDSVSDVKRDEQQAGKAASAEALKSGTTSLDDSSSGFGADTQKQQIALVGDFKDRLNKTTRADQKQPAPEKTQSHSIS